MPKKKKQTQPLPLRYQKHVIEHHIEFSDKRFFKDNLPHLYDCKCYDGYAICYAQSNEDNVNVPPTIIVTYPKKANVLSDDNLCMSILNYRGLYDLQKEDIHFGDIMLYLGKVEKDKQPQQQPNQEREWVG